MFTTFDLKLSSMPKFNLREELIQIFSGTRWNIKCILDTEGNEMPIPKNSTCITAILEEMALPKLKKLTDNYGIEIIPAKTTREYPDATLQGGILGSKKIAIDIKTTRRIKGNDNRISGFTIGSYAGYFLHPDEKKPGCRIPYSEFGEHWIVGFIYDWNPQENSSRMVSNIETIVAPKWKIASKSTGTGTTFAISSVRDINRLRTWNGDFKTQKEFEEYWRNYAKRVRKRR